METSLAQIRDQQKASWDQFSGGWKKWDELMMQFMKPMGDAIISKLKPIDGDLVLDIAAGTGEPGMTIAGLIPNGKVISTDLSEGMLQVAREHAQIRGLKNFETRICDVCELPFPDNHFDVVSCRFGFMFFPDMQLAANEMSRVLKKGGRIATTVWNIPEKNFWVTAISSVINRNLNITPPPPGAPGMFRCAERGLIAGLFRKAGMLEVAEMEIKSELRFNQSESYWTMMTDVAAPFVAALSKASETEYEKIHTEVIQLLKERYPEGVVNFEASSLLIFGEK